MIRRSLLLYLSLGVLLLGPMSRVQAENLVWVDESVDGNKVYVDQDSIRRQGGIVWYWETLIRQMPDTEGAVTTRLYRSANCQTNQMRIRQVIKLDRQKRVIRFQKYGDKGPVIKLQPDSLAYTVLRFVCEP